MAEPYVLVVEDDRLVREMLVRWLRSLGYQSTAVETAENALLAIDRERPMAVISDVMMPVHDGLWLLEEIHTRWPSLPVVMSSGATLDNEWLHRARRLGAVDFMAKPFARETLYQTLARVISPNGPLE